MTFWTAPVNYMISDKRALMVAPCGIDCGICELYLCKDNKQLFQYLLSKGIPEKSLPCNGCRSIKGKCPVINDKCATFDCVSSKNVEFCYDCNEFPCEKLNPAANRADILPHNTKVFNLCTIKNFGIEQFINKSSEIKQKYYMGKMEVGKGPRIPD